MKIESVVKQSRSFLSTLGKKGNIPSSLMKLPVVSLLVIAYLVLIQRYQVPALVQHPVVRLVTLAVVIYVMSRDMLVGSLLGLAWILSVAWSSSAMEGFEEETATTETSSGTTNISEGTGEGIPKDDLTQSVLSIANRLLKGKDYQPPVEDIARDKAVMEQLKNNPDVVNALQGLGKGGINISNYHQISEQDPVMKDIINNKIRPAQGGGVVEQVLKEASPKKKTPPTNPQANSRVSVENFVAEFQPLHPSPEAMKRVINRQRKGAGCSTHPCPDGQGINESYLIDPQYTVYPNTANLGPFDMAWEGDYHAGLNSFAANN